MLTRIRNRVISSLRHAVEDNRVQLDMAWERGADENTCSKLIRREAALCFILRLF